MKYIFLPIHTPSNPPYEDLYFDRPDMKRADSHHEHIESVDARSGELARAHENGVYEQWGQTDWGETTDTISDERLDESEMSKSRHNVYYNAVALAVPVNKGVAPLLPSVLGEQDLRTRRRHQSGLYCKAEPGPDDYSWLLYVKENLEDMKVNIPELWDEVCEEITDARRNLEGEDDQSEASDGDDVERGVPGVKDGTLYGTYSMHLRHPNWQGIRWPVNGWDRRPLPPLSHYAEVSSDFMASVLAGEAGLEGMVRAEGQLTRLLVQTGTNYYRMCFLILWLKVVTNWIGDSPAYEVLQTAKAFVDVMHETKVMTKGEKQCDRRSVLDNSIKSVGILQAAWMGTERRVRVDVAWMNLLTQIHDFRCEHLGDLRFEMCVCSSHGVVCTGRDDSVDPTVGFVLSKA